MDPQLRKQLLEASCVSDFLRILHGDTKLKMVAPLLRPHGGPKTPQAISDYMAREKLSPKVQKAYAIAFGFEDDHELRVHLQDLVVASSLAA